MLVGVAFIRGTLIMLQKCGHFTHKKVACWLLCLGLHVYNVVSDANPIDISCQFSVVFFLSDANMFFFNIIMLLLKQTHNKRR